VYRLNDDLAIRRGSYYTWPPRTTANIAIITAVANANVVIKYIGIVTNFLISKKGLSFQITLKLHKNPSLNHFAPLHISLKRLYPLPPDLNTVGKLRLSSFCINKNIGGLL
jgi:hypothetical protein